MAYSDYGGYAYRNGIRVEERSDCVLSPEGLRSTPGQWPGWTIEEGRAGGSYHAVLGDGPIFVTMYKQSSILIFNKGEEIKYSEQRRSPELLGGYKDSVYIDVPENSTQWIKVHGHTIEIRYEYSDNYYSYVRVIQPDETVWLGFSGYGVGAGLEDCGYGFSTQEQEERLFAAFSKPAREERDAD